MLAIGLGIRACQAGHCVAFATAAEWVARLATAHQQGPASLPEPIMDSATLTRLRIRRPDRLGGLLHEYDHAE